MLLLVGFLVIAGKLYDLQILRGGELSKKAAIQRQENNMLVHRGTITDRHGLPLAVDTTRYDIVVHPDLLKVSKEEAARRLAEITKEDFNSIFKLISSGYNVVTIARHLGREEADELQALNWTGIDINAISFRHYPEGRLAAHLLGYVNMDTQGQGGIEQAQENKLKDIGSITKPQLDGHGKPILIAGNGTSDITPPLGRHVELTVDNYIQHLAEKELSAMVRHSHAARGTAIVTDPTTGEILAWANYPSYDPNNYSKYLSTMKNWSLVDVYEPGSTFKIITVACGLDLGTIKPNSIFQDSGSINIGNRTIHNHEPGGHGSIDLLHLFIHSSNVAAAQVGLSMTPAQFYGKLKDLGIGNPTGVELLGESAGLLRSPQYWSPIDQAATGFGQGAVALTPLQLVSAVGAVANGGTWIQPHLIRRIYDPKTGVTERWTDPKKRTVLSPATTDLVCSLLAENIKQGTQIAGKAPGYRVAGKTGTAQKSISGGRGYIPGQTVASFIGFLPAKNPQLLCLVVVDSPQSDGRWGNTIAGPVFNAIATEAARYLGIPPTEKIDASKIPPAPSVLYAKEFPAKEPSGAESR